MIPAHDKSRMLLTPFHEGVRKACEANEWENWKGYTTPLIYSEVDMEYFAIRNGCGVFDLTPMTKYSIHGSQAAEFLNKLMTRNVQRLAVGQVMYTCWCNDAGQVLDDGTLFRLADEEYRLCSQERHLDWLLWTAMGFDVQIRDETAEVAALALQGPTSCATLNVMGFSGVDHIKPYRFQSFDSGDGEILISRTGFTGDLGYELWVAPDKAMALWNLLFAAGKQFGIRPFGGEALKIARIEAGFIQAGVDFVPAESAVRADRTRSPFELGLNWLVDLKKPFFTGRASLVKERSSGSRFQLVRLVVDGNKPAHHAFIYNKHKNVVGTVTSATWSPTLKSNLALACLDAPWGAPEKELYAEIYDQKELKWTRTMARCKVVDAFFDPPRRHAVPAGNY